MSEQYLKNVVEAALLAAGRPLSLDDLASLLEEARRPARAEIEAAIAALDAEYAGRGIEIKETAAGFRVQVRRELAEEVSRLWPDRPPRYSRALLETLALIAYRQPITRGEIEAVRGVAVNPNIVKTLLERNWIRVVGQRDVPGRPELLGTTREFLDYFGLKSLDELPPLAELKAMADLNVQLEFAGAPRSGASPERELSEGASPAAGSAGEGSGAGASSETATVGASSSRHEPSAGGANAGDEPDALSRPAGPCKELEAAEAELEEEEYSSEDPESSPGLVARAADRG